MMKAAAPTLMVLTAFLWGYAFGSEFGHRVFATWSIIIGAFALAFIVLWHLYEEGRQWPM
jgi:hypothetical protein